MAKLIKRHSAKDYVDGKVVMNRSEHEFDMNTFIATNNDIKLHKTQVVNKFNCFTKFIKDVEEHICRMANED